MFTRKSTSAYMSGLSSTPGLSMLSRTLRVRVIGSTCGWIKSIRALKTLPGMAWIDTRAVSPKRMFGASYSNTSAMIQTWLRSTIVYRSVSGITFNCGNALRSVIYPVMGEYRVMFLIGWPVLNAAMRIAWLISFVWMSRTCWPGLTWARGSRAGMARWVAWAMSRVASASRRSAVSLLWSALVMSAD